MGLERVVRAAYLLRRGPAWVAEVDLVVLVPPPVEGQALLCQVLAEPGDGRRLGVVRPEVQHLRGDPSSHATSRTLRRALRRHVAEVPSRRAAGVLFRARTAAPR
jgi:hypothetical protein